MDKKTYQLFLKIPIEAVDDIEARSIADVLYKDMLIDMEKCEIKLQEIFSDKAPRKVNF